MAFVVISFDVPGCNSAPIFPDTGLSFVQEYMSKEKKLSLESPLLCWGCNHDDLYPRNFIIPPGQPHLLWWWRFPPRKFLREYIVIHVLNFSCPLVDKKTPPLLRFNPIFLAKYIISWRIYYTPSEQRSTYSEQREQYTQSVSSGRFHEVNNKQKLQKHQANKWSRSLMRGGRLGEVLIWLYGFEWEHFSVSNRW